MAIIRPIHWEDSLKIDELNIDNSTKMGLATFSWYTKSNYWICTLQPRDFSYLPLCFIKLHLEHWQFNISFILYVYICFLYDVYLFHLKCWHFKIVQNQIFLHNFFFLDFWNLKIKNVSTYCGDHSAFFKRKSLI